MEAWREKKGFPLRGPLPDSSFHYPPPGRPPVRNNSLPPERTTWQTDEELASREQVEKLKGLLRRDGGGAPSGFPWASQGPLGP
eukprot:12116396-Alexandrium_andersonii.AAC.1